MKRKEIKKERKMLGTRSCFRKEGEFGETFDVASFVLLLIWKE